MDTCMETGSTVKIKQEINLLVVVLLLTCCNLRQIYASCSEDQLKSCRTSLIYGDVLSMPGGGKCQETRSRVHFSHVCIVTKYLPNVAHCCCQLDHAAADDIINSQTSATALCCRYHDGGALFRCQSPADDVHIASQENSVMLVIVLPTILIALLVSVSVAVVCCRRHYANVSSQDDFTDQRASRYQFSTNTCCCCATKISPSADSEANCLTSCLTSLGRRDAVADRQQPVKTTVDRHRPPLTLTSQSYLEPSAPQLITVCTSPAASVQDPAISTVDCRGNMPSEPSPHVNPIESAGWCRCGRQCDLPPPSYDEVQGQVTVNETVTS